MADKLSITKGDEEIDLNPNTRDRIRSWLSPIIKTISKLQGLEPWGSLMTETVLNIIPDQRQERLKSLIDVLNIRTKHLAEDFAELKQRLQSAEGTDLLEDALDQASRALSNERLEYIASILINGLTEDELEHAGKKRLLSLLGQLSDPEIIILRFHSILSIAEQRKFAEAHKELLMPALLRLRSPQQDIDKAALRNAHTANLISLELLQPQYPPLKKGEVPEYNQRTGMPQARGYKATALGHVLLRHIGIAVDWNPAS